MALVPESHFIQRLVTFSSFVAILNSTELRSGICKRGPSL